MAREPMAHGRDTGPPGVGGTWNSTLSSEEFAAVRGVGFDPVGQVFGTTVFNRSPWNSPGQWAGTCGAEWSSSMRVSSSSQTVQSMYAARTLALTRVVAECRTLGGDGIVGVTLRVGKFPAGGLEFTAWGTAVRARSRIRPRLPFTSHLSGQDFAKLMDRGWVPTGLAFGIALATRHDDWRTSRRKAWTAENQEVPAYTRLLHHARQDARGRLALEAVKHGGDGVVVEGPELTVSESECPGIEGARDLTAEAVFVGTTIARYRRSERPAGPGTLTIMRLERER
ncbi:heavy metal-binding domain-containing protein [Streptomyces sp. NPDC054849]